MLPNHSAQEEICQVPKTFLDWVRARNPLGRQQVEFNTPHLKIDETMTIGPLSAQTKITILRGDNLHGLAALLVEGAKFDGIITDPPYGALGENALYYDGERRIDSLPPHLQQFAFLEDHYNRACMFPHLLRDDRRTLVFVNIDEHNEHSLALLYNELLQMYPDVCWNKGKRKNLSIQTSEQTETILMGTKNKEISGKIEGTKGGAGVILDYAQNLHFDTTLTLERKNELLSQFIDSKKDFFSGGEKTYKYIDNEGNVFARDNLSSPDVAKGYKYDVIHPVTKKVCKMPDNGWRHSEDSFKELVAQNQISFGKNEKSVPRFKRLLKEQMSEIFTNYIYNADSGVDDLVKERLSKDFFPNPKPLSLLIPFVLLLPKDAKILDPWAGSGTLAIAVAIANKMDGGTREVVLIQRDNDNGNNICTEKTYVRVKNAISVYGLDAQIRMFDILGNKSIDSKLEVVADEKKLAYAKEMVDMLKLKYKIFNPMKSTIEDVQAFRDGNRFLCFVFKPERFYQVVERFKALRKPEWHCIFVLFSFNGLTPELPEDLDFHAEICSVPGRAFSILRRAYIHVETVSQNPIPNNISRQSLS